MIPPFPAYLWGACEQGEITRPTRLPSRSEP